MEILAILAYFVFLLVISVAIVVSGIVRFIEGGQRRGTLLLKLIISLAVWLTSSIMMLYFNFGYVYGSAHTDPESRDKLLWPLLVVFLNACYCVGGTVLYYKLFQPSKRGDIEEFGR
jgi:hypothetical protein